MNKQELIEKYKSALNKVHKVYGDYYKTEAYEEVLKDLKQLDEPQKPVVKQFVADWYEKNKDDFDYRVWECIYHDGEGKQTEMSEWICQNENAIITLVNMHQFGYTVEKEKRYLVKVIGMSKFYECLNFDTTENRWKFFDCDNTKIYRTHHTHKELEKAGFGWVFDCEGIEIEEVEG